MQSILCEFQYKNYYLAIRHRLSFALIYTLFNCSALFMHISVFVKLLIRTYRRMCSAAFEYSIRWLQLRREMNKAL